MPPLDFVVEGAAENAVDLVFAREERASYIKDVLLLPMIGKSHLANSRSLSTPFATVTASPSAGRLERPPRSGGSVDLPRPQ